jgi:hypothetical protein
MNDFWRMKDFIAFSFKEKIPAAAIKNKDFLIWKSL